MAHLPFVSTEAAMLMRGGHPITHETHGGLMGQTEEGSEWKVRGIVWKQGEEPVLYLVGKNHRTAWAPYSDVQSGLRI